MLTTKNCSLKNKNATREDASAKIKGEIFFRLLYCSMVKTINKAGKQNSTPGKLKEKLLAKIKPSVTLKNQ